IGIARVVMHTKEHLAALIPSGALLMLNTIRWATEIRPLDEIKVPAQGTKATGLLPAEMKMAAQLIKDMTGPWKPQDYADQFSDAVNALVRKKVKAGDTQTVIALEGAPDATSHNIIDLTELLANSLSGRKKSGNAVRSEGRPGTVKKLTTKPPAPKRA
ncbi:MAG: Ku protein, partial [Candidatus Saccharibacteria bacterium]|nr:Ku protein [Rhodoferax sp.]